MNDREWGTLLGELASQTELVVATCSELDLTQDSALPDWTRAHVVAHLIGNARGLGRLARWANDGIERGMYPSMAAREGDVELRARWSDAELVLALGQSSLELQSELEQLDVAARERIVRRSESMSFPGDRIPALRLQEVVIHHTDLGVGEYTHEQWPDAMVAQMYRALVREYAGRDDSPVGFINDDVLNDTSVGVRGTKAAAIAWLIGRSDGGDLEIIGAEALPTPPAWR